MNAAHCPSCALSTLRGSCEGVTTFRCEACEGHFIAGPLLEEFLAAQKGVRAHARLLERARDAPLTQRTLTCPQCRTRSYHAVRAGLVEIDVCATCGGIFLDRGETLLFLKQVREHPSPERLLGHAIDGAESLPDMLSLAHFISRMFH